jgi:DnaJ family protein C protein 13
LDHDLYFSILSHQTLIFLRVLLANFNKICTIQIKELYFCVSKNKLSELSGESVSKPEPEGQTNKVEKSLEIKNAIVFFNDLYHRFLLSNTQMKSMCLEAMTIVYTKCHREIGSFHDTKYIVAMLDRTLDRQERDRLLMFIDSLILDKQNVKEILDANGIRVFVDLLTLAHLHTNRAYVPTQTNVIEASKDSVDREADSEKEWYYGSKVGPFSFREVKELFAQQTIDPKTR